MVNAPYSCSKLHGEHNADKISQYIKEGIDPNSNCLDSMKPLHWSRNAHTTEVLIKAGADLTDTNKHDMYLYKIIYGIPYEIIAWTIAYKASKNLLNIPIKDQSLQNSPA
tara:strand:- start:517 stop:846 length:330 start_codon:yes stop_codon:yes gene_type:complete